MDREKEIDEMAEDMYSFLPDSYDVNERDCIYAAEEMFAKGYRKQEWISVNEKLPEPNKTVLCIWKRENEDWNYGFARYQHDDIWYVSNEGIPLVTHWMYIPEFAKMREKE